MRELSLEGEWAMPKGRRLGAEQIVTKLRQIEVLQGQGKNIAAACKEIGTTEQTFYRWRKEYGGLNVDQAKRLKQLEDENGRLKKLVADLSLEKQVLRDIAQGKL
jgi:transposase-like protein